MFVLNNHYKRTRGYVETFDVPFSERAGTHWEAGWEDSLWTAVKSLGRNVEYWMAEDWEWLNADQANEMFPGMDFKDPIPVDLAEAKAAKKRGEAQRDEYLASLRPTVGGVIGGFATEMLSANLTPIDIALNFIPIVGSASKLERIGKNANRVRRALTRGIITDEQLVKWGTPFPKIAEAAIEGSFGNAIAEVPIYLQKRADQLDYTLGDVATSVTVGAVFGVGLRLGLEGLSKMLSRADDIAARTSPETRQAMDRKATSDLLNDRPIDVSREYKMDRNVIHDRLAAEENIRRFTADPRPTEFQNERLARNIIEAEGSLGRANRGQVIEIARQQVARAKDRNDPAPKFAIMARILEKEKPGQHLSVQDVNNLAGQLELIVDQSAVVFPPFYRAANAPGSLSVYRPSTGERIRTQDPDIFSRMERLEQLDEQIKAKQQELSELSVEGKDPRVVNRQARALKDDIAKLTGERDVTSQSIDARPLTQEERIAEHIRAEKRRQAAAEADYNRQLREYIQAAQADNQRARDLEDLAMAEANRPETPENTQAYAPKPDEDQAATYKKIEEETQAEFIDPEMVDRWTEEELKANDAYFEPEHIKAAVDCMLTKI